MSCFWSGILSCRNIKHYAMYVNVDTKFVLFFNGNHRNRSCKDLCVHRAQTLQTDSTSVWEVACFINLDYL